MADKKLNLLKIEIKNRYVQENFKRIETYLNKVILDAINDLDPTTGGGNNNNSTAVSSVWTRGDSIVYAEQARSIDLLPLSGFISIKYIMTFSNADEEKAVTLELTILHENGTIKDVVSNKIGRSISLGVDTNVNTNNELEINITNNELFDVNISYARLVL
jgi:hypothetical protein